MICARVRRKMQPNKECFRFYTLTEHKLKLSAREIYNKLLAVWGDQTPHYTTITRWIADFDSGRRTSLSDSCGADHGRPVSASGDDKIALVKQIFDDDPRLSTREIEAVS